MDEWSKNLLIKEICQIRVEHGRGISFSDFGYGSHAGAHPFAGELQSAIITAERIREYRDLYGLDSAKLSGQKGEQSEKKRKKSQRSFSQHSEGYGIRPCYTCRN